MSSPVGEQSWDVELVCDDAEGQGGKALQSAASTPARRSSRARDPQAEATESKPRTRHSSRLGPDGGGWPPLAEALTLPLP